MRGSVAYHALKIMLGRANPKAQTTGLETELLRTFAANALVAAEIGVAEGGNTHVIASALRGDGVLWAIDPFPAGAVGVRWGQIAAASYLRRLGLEGRVRIVRSLSWDALDRVPSSLDFAFIDGDHSWDGISRDWSDWSPRIRPGGHVCLHDVVAIEGGGGQDLGLPSFAFFERVIRLDRRFTLVASADSLAVLQRIHG